MILLCMCSLHRVRMNLVTCTATGMLMRGSFALTRKGGRMLSHGDFKTRTLYLQKKGWRDI